MSRITALSGYFFRTSVRTKSFVAISAISALSVILLGYLSYQTLNISGYASLGYVLNRIHGIEKQDLVYFLWSIPYQVLIVLIPVVISSGIFSTDYENGESYVYYSYPVSWQRIFLSKFIASVLVSLIPVTLYAGIEAAVLSSYFRTLPPEAMLMSYLLTVLILVTIISFTAFLSQISRNALVATLLSLIIILVMMNIINLYFLMTGGGEPSYILYNDVQSVTQVFSMINIFPIGSSGYVGAASTFRIIRDVSFMGLYSSISVAAAIILMNGSDAS